MDFSACCDIDHMKVSGYDNNLRIDIYHMGINELIRNAQLLSRFKNGEELVVYYCNIIRDEVGIVIDHMISGWEWGMHGNPVITPFADKLREFVVKNMKNSHPRPVYGMIDMNSESIVLSYIIDTIQSRVLSVISDEGQPADD